MAGIDTDGGGIDLYPEQARAAITEMKTVATAIGETFESRLGQVAQLDSQLGKGTLGAQAYMQYQPAVDEAVPQIRELNTAAPAYADGGLRCVDTLVTQDQVNQQNLEGVQRPNVDI